jgi:rhodanese-related sulfurtransferase
MRILPTIRQLTKKGGIWFALTGEVAALVALTVFLAWLPVQARQPSSPGKVQELEVSGVELLLRFDPNLYLVDVRTPEELIGPLGNIPQARNVTMQEIEKNPEQFPRDKTLVLICRSGHRSLKAANLLAERGYAVYSVQGGMQAWRKLHPSASPPVEGAPPNKVGETGHGPDTRKSPPQENQDHPPPEKHFFDSNMGC